MNVASTSNQSVIMAFHFTVKNQYDDPIYSLTPISMYCITHYLVSTIVYSGDHVAYNNIHNSQYLMIIIDNFCEAQGKGKGGLRQG